MAKIAEATVFVDEVNGNRLTLSEKHSKSDPMSHAWTVTGYTNVTAWLPRDYAGPDIVKGQRLKVSATQRTERREVAGKVYNNLIWNLTTVERVHGEAQTAADSRVEYQQSTGPVNPNAETPF